LVDTKLNKNGSQQEPDDSPLDSIVAIEIERRAYEIYLERGSEPGQDLDDWLQAEREIKNENS
jgi:hypothetical protein